MALGTVLLLDNYCPVIRNRVERVHPKVFREKEGPSRNGFREPNKQGSDLAYKEEDGTTV